MPGLSWRRWKDFHHEDTKGTKTSMKETGGSEALRGRAVSFVAFFVLFVSFSLFGKSVR